MGVSVRDRISPEKAMNLPLTELIRYLPGSGVLFGPPLLPASANRRWCRQTAGNISGRVCRPSFTRSGRSATTGGRQLLAHGQQGGQRVPRAIAQHQFAL